VDELEWRRAGLRPSRKKGTWETKLFACPED
jgi:hypothetical protein